MILRFWRVFVDFEKVRVWKEVMVGTTGGQKIASLVKIQISLESGRRDESKYVLYNYEFWLSWVIYFVPGNSHPPTCSPDGSPGGGRPPLSDYYGWSPAWLVEVPVMRHTHPATKQTYVCWCLTIANIFNSGSKRTINKTHDTHLCSAQLSSWKTTCKRSLSHNFVYTVTSRRLSTNSVTRSGLNP